MAHRIIPVKYYLINATVLTLLMALTIAAAKQPRLYSATGKIGS